MNEAAEPRRCGLVAVLGAPNVGKSTLVNRLVGTKVSIVSPKVQTTRTRIMGIAMAGAAQVVFVDTPGIFAPRRRLDRAMVQAAWDSAGDADLVLLVIDAERGVDEAARAIIARLRAAGCGAIAVINKIDRVPRPALLAMTANLVDLGIGEQAFMVSALSGDGVGDLRAFVSARMPEGPWLFPEDQLSDMPARIWAAEITREQVFLQLRQELPHAAAVTTDAWREQPDGSVRIEQTIHVQREGQRAIVLGARGRQIKEIGTRARIELEKSLERRVHLFLQVRLHRDWPEEARFLGDLGLDSGR